ncbi:hypothetical protein AT15_01980 [Kosmotoga arenicorallina S304]|uniref:Uncharacterized protein n=1 Tax=Kosmotoga arenicorallina S304 TaxID=1453497 RepID=A0A176JZF5_9BACT|nr:HD-GYP domain-containing protein [Kosmotoga arenicorallina]OAA29465.1 hypothetical protein AT15_01980 [Kosmotoga arenicorallina S304]
MRRKLIYVSVFLFVAIVALLGFYHLNITRFTERIESSKSALKLSVILLTEKLSYGYFQWTEFYEAVKKGETGFIEKNFSEILAGSSAVNSVEIINRPAAFSDKESLYKVVAKDSMNLIVYFNIFDDLLENVVDSKVVRADISLGEFLNAYGLSSLIEVNNSKTGTPLVFGLKYKFKTFPIKLLHIVSALSMALLSTLIVQRMIESEISAHYQTVGLEAIAFLFEQRDRYTANHSKKVAAISVALGKILGIKGKKLKTLERAALLHDIGKIGIPEEILTKRGKLTAEEYFIIKRHPEVGASVLGKIPYLKNLIPIILYHHERMDGSGYPEGLKKDEIPMLARVLAVADVFDALISDRPYRPAMNIKSAIKEMESMPLDQEIVSAFKNNIDYVLMNSAKQKMLTEQKLFVS